MNRDAYWSEVQRLKRARHPPVPEQQLVRVALTYLNGPARCLAWRINVLAMGGRSPAGTRRWVQSAPTGHPDIAGVLPGGRALFVECKSATGRLRPQQTEIGRAHV